MKPAKKSIILFSILLVIPALAIIHGCSSDKYYFFTDEEEALMVYVKGDQLKFKNTSGSVCTYTVTDLIRGYEVDGSAHNEHQEASIALENDTNSVLSYGDVFMVKRSDGLTATVKWPYYPVTINLVNAVLGNDTVNGVIYTDVVRSSMPGNGYGVDEVHYSKTKGFVKYVDYTGMAWSKIN
jgi:hypothetical protein